MIDKIDLYREVLAIEPNSKAFFPLARALAEAGRQDEAIAVLETGIGFHPDHLEARFLLVEIYAGLDREFDAVRVFAGVRDSLVRYPAVWRLWSRHAGFSSRDPVLALSFLAQFFRDPSLTFVEVLEKGLQVLAGSAPAEAASPQPLTVAAAAAEPEAEGPPPRAPAGEESAATTADMAPPPAAAPEDVVPSGVAARREGDPTAMPLRGADEVKKLTGLLEMAGVAAPSPEALAEPAAEAPSAASPTRTVQIPDLGIRTRTMASLLAAQGDVQGALDIYAELAARLPAGPERTEIEARIAELTPGPAASPEPAPTREPGPAETPAKPRGKAKLIGLLDALAGRLDARSRA